MICSELHTEHERVSCRQENRKLWLLISRYSIWRKTILQYPSQVQGKCQTDCIVYRATVTEVGAGKVETYEGVTRNKTKRYSSHNSDMKNSKYRSNSCPRKHVWDLKNNNRKQFNFDWRLVDRSSSLTRTLRNVEFVWRRKGGFI